MFVTTKLEAAQSPEAAIPAIVDNSFLTEIFATGTAGVADVGGVLVVTFECARCDHSQAEPVMERVIVGRLALTVAAAQGLVVNLNAYLEDHGLSPSRAVAGAASVQ
ncbi:hypothetical protein [Sphingomonas qomolangmaensis]|uniref:Uncharacterized protein n=1 Tax=Sphingomonas qomolangmaensis TaxID=2918765 RepID=A0ABY5LBJ2_9SPHN|nr:hypothetical protein [Sphingomonas qomolangmaensis]UUL83164.1 hypothetical protein NMP03_02710 [Sphingomonas qomolangmaensis]